VKTRDEVKAASKLGADLIFLDAFVQDEFGGTGKISNWEEISESGVDLSAKFVLSGGLTSENVCDAIRKLNPYGVDAASGVESSPGKKDPEKVKEFISNAKLCG
jgi:phosphoribosylanthranilate isomerase